MNFDPQTDISEKCDTKECQDFSDVKAGGYIFEKEDNKVVKDLSGQDDTKAVEDPSD